MIIIIKDIIKISTNKIYASTKWYVRANSKKDYLALTQNQFKALEPITDKVDLSFSFYFTKNALDSSNCSYMAKMIEDCLVEYGVLKDDTIKYVGKISLTSQRDKTKDNYCILEITKSL